MKTLNSAGLLVLVVLIALASPVVQLLEPSSGVLTIVGAAVFVGATARRASGRRKSTTPQTHLTD